MLGSDGRLAESQGLPLRQVAADGFEVGATLRYVGETGLDASFDAAVRTLPLDSSRRSDLASVPAVMGWFERPHGAHTPAALFHDYLLVRPDLVAPEQADLVFRHMLKALRIPTVKRNLMWTAVALRTRWETSAPRLLLWLALSIAGLVSFLLAAVGVDFPEVIGGRWGVLVIASVAPLPSSLLWGGARRAALVAAVMAIWILPAAAIALVALAVYELVERLVARLRQT